MDPQKQVILLDAQAYFKLMLTRLARIGKPYSHLAMRAGINPSQIWRWKKGLTEPTLSSLQRIETSLREMEAEYDAAQ